MAGFGASPRVYFENGVLGSGRSLQVALPKPDARGRLVVADMRP
jgi:hypothetical protein